MLNRLKGLWKDEQGQAMSEYGLIIALIAIAVIGVLGVMSGALTTILTKISTALTAA